MKKDKQTQTSIVFTEKESNLINEVLELWIKSKSTVWDDLYRSSLKSNDKEIRFYKDAKRLSAKLKTLL